MAKTKVAPPAKQAKSAKKEESNDFISDDALSTGSASYLKLKDKETKFRIISKPISGWIEWIDQKPVRTTLADGEPEASDDEKPPKKFVTFAVIDRKDGLIKILELTQQSVIKAIKALANNPDWGNPFTYDINVTKTGESLKTKYTVQPSPKKPLGKVEIAAAEEKKCNLEALFAGEDPWDVDGADNVTEYFFK